MEKVIKQRSFYADMGLYQRLSLLSVIEGKDRSALINQAIAEFLDRQQIRIPQELEVAS